MGEKVNRRKIVMEVVDCYVTCSFCNNCYLAHSTDPSMVKAPKDGPAGWGSISVKTGVSTFMTYVICPNCLCSKEITK